MAHDVIKKRRVFYIPGYDPIHPRRYRELYRSEGRDQAQISGYDLALSAKQAKGRYGWHVEGNIDGRSCASDFEVLVWSDIVRTSMTTGIVGTYILMARTAWTYIGSGALRRLMWLRKGPVIAALYPLVMLILQALLAIGLAVFAGWLLAQLHHWLAWLGLFLIPIILMFFRKYDNKFFVYYLMHDYSYSAQSKGANPPELEQRMAEFGDAIAQALTGEFDEVLVVGHSSGAHLGVSILADLMRQDQIPKDGPVLSFLTLGQVVPMVSFLPKADRLRRDLHDLCQCPHIAWVDVTAPGDGCAFALCDPVAVSGVAPPDQKWPIVFSAAFSQTLSPEKWSALKRRYFRLHFQYLCAFDRPGDYDYFKITAGGQSLAERYENRAHSKSRIILAASKFTSMSP